MKVSHMIQWLEKQDPERNIPGIEMHVGPAA
jgi:hypothetical protein